MHHQDTTSTGNCKPKVSLAGIIGDVARALLGEPNKRLSSRRQLRFGNKGSVSVCLDRDVWFDHEVGEGGGVADLIRRHVGNEPGAVARWLEAFGVGQGLPQRITRVERSAGLSIEDEQARQRAKQIWNAASPALTGTPAEAYLRSRGIWGPGKDAKLRFARLPHPETGEVLACIVVPRVDIGERQVQGIQRIFLTEGGRKYRDGTAKMSLGRVTGCAPLFNPAEHLGLAEGVETALSVALLIGGPCWAMCGGFPAGLTLPSEVRRVTIVADHDTSGISLQRGQALAGFLMRRNIRADVVMPEPEGADANDIAAGVA